MDDYPPADEPIPDPDQGRYSELIRFLNESNDMRKTAKNAVKQGLWAGGGAMLGAVTLGPVGGLVGGVMGSVIGFFQSDDYDGIVLSIMKLDDSHRNRLIVDVGTVLVSAGASMQQIQDPDGFYNSLLQYTSQDSVRNGVWSACMNSLRD